MVTSDSTMRQVHYLSALSPLFAIAIVITRVATFNPCVAAEDFKVKDGLHSQAPNKLIKDKCGEYLLPDIFPI